jgi:hypothetical protein
MAFNGDFWVAAAAEPQVNGDFWVAAAAAAPVIALASVVVIDRTWVSEAFSAALAARPSDKVRHAARVGITLAWSAYIIGFLNLFVQTLALLSALWALSEGDDSVFLSQGWVILLEVLGLFSLGFTSLLIGGSRWRLAQMPAEAIGPANRMASDDDDDE